MKQIAVFNGVDTTPGDSKLVLTTGSQEFQIRKLEFRDIKQVAQLHAIVFPDYFLTHLGQQVLQVFYSSFIDHDSAYANVAVVDGRIVAFVAGNSNSQAFFNDFYAKYFNTILKNVLLHFISDKVIRRDIYSRLSHIRRAIASKFLREKQVAIIGGSKISMRLLSIGVDADCRGQGVAEKLTEVFLGQVGTTGIDRIGLSVMKSNSRAIAFYEKTGWLRELETPNTLLFWRSTAIDTPSLK